MNAQKIQKLQPKTSQTDHSIEAIKEASIAAFHKMSEEPGFQKIVTGNINTEEYKSVLREIYYQTRETPPMMGSLCSHLRGTQREAIKTLFKHACAEMGHDQIALQDLRVLGENTDEVEVSRPLPETTALIAYAYHQIQRMDPAGFLGFIYFLEFVPSISGGVYMERLEKAGIPRSAMCFIEEHSYVDPAHVKLLDKYVESIVTSHEHLQAVIYGIECTAKLYGRMITSAIENAATQSDRPTDPIEEREKKNVS